MARYFSSSRQVPVFLFCFVLCLAAMCLRCVGPKIRRFLEMEAFCRNLLKLQLKCKAAAIATLEAFSAPVCGLGSSV